MGVEGSVFTSVDCPLQARRRVCSLAHSYVNTGSLPAVFVVYVVLVYVEGVVLSFCLLFPYSGLIYWFSHYFILFRVFLEIICMHGEWQRIGS